MDRHVNDHYVKKAKQFSYRSRAAFKLIEIDDKHRIFKKGMRVIDVGAAPGGWTQVAVEKVHSRKGRVTVVAVDLLRMQDVEGCHFIQGDIEDPAVQEEVSKAHQHEKAQIVISDAVPDFIGDRFIDQCHAFDLCQQILLFCDKMLIEGGTLLMKIIQGPSEQILFDRAMQKFAKVQRVKPQASRSESAEIYYLCLGFDQSTDPSVLKAKDFAKKFDKMQKAEKEGKTSEMSDLFDEMMDTTQGQI